MERLKFALFVGFVAVGFGGCLRIGADRFSQYLVSKRSAEMATSRRSDPGEVEFFQEVGAWSIGFGLIVIALLLNQWVSRELAPPRLQMPPLESEIPPKKPS